MAFTTQAQLQGALKTAQIIVLQKGSRTTANFLWVNAFDVAGVTPAGVASVANTTTGVVPTDADAGYPAIDAFAAGLTGYLTSVHCGGVSNISSLGCRYILADAVWRAGSYSFNSNIATASGVLATRIPGGDYSCLALWVEVLSTFTGNPVFTITYTNELGVAGRTATLNVGAAPAIGQMILIPLQAGDRGISAITNVAATVATVGTFGLWLLRPLWMGRIDPGGEITHGPDKTDLPIVYDTSALMIFGSPQVTANSPTPAYFELGIAQG